MAAVSSMRRESIKKWTAADYSRMIGELLDWKSRKFTRTRSEYMKNNIRLLTDGLRRRIIQISPNDERLFCECLEQLVFYCIKCERRHCLGAVFHVFCDDNFEQVFDPFAAQDAVRGVYSNVIEKISSTITSEIQRKRCCTHVQHLLVGFWFGRLFYFDDARAQQLLKECMALVFTCKRLLDDTKHAMYISSIALQSAPETLEVIKRISKLKDRFEIWQYGLNYCVLATAHAKSIMAQEPDRAEALLVEAERLVEKTNENFSFLTVQKGLCQFVRNRLDLARPLFQEAIEQRGADTGCITFSRGSMHLLENPELEEELASGRLAYISVPSGVAACYFDILCQEKATGQVTKENVVEIVEVVDRHLHDERLRAIDESFHNPFTLGAGSVELFVYPAFCHMIAASLYKKCGCNEEAKTQLERASSELEKRRRHPLLQRRVTELINELM